MSNPPPDAAAVVRALLKQSRLQRELIMDLVSLLDDIVNLVDDRADHNAVLAVDRWRDSRGRLADAINKMDETDRVFEEMVE